MSEVEYDYDLKSCVHVIEDHDGFRDALIMILEGAGYDAYGHCDAEAFLNASNMPAPHCIISDVVMPGMSGVELQVTLADTVPEIPVILITAHGNVPKAVQATKAGVSTAE
ncbi:MAG: response regulator [Rhodospirillaceae bacterium]|nr:response regulator [Rhodospirillaceae bacterium]MBT8002266.1 response regulator [Rhodospirillales bacterium]